eukprot:TRINITY_DN4618_c0_g1_i3.p1 TRINITY_DN4618_c0_g1~~TRINITY_DN4618_c0_g1_i3.p1  ORF type:complete len:323 (+),score=78.81 TRINITY_DN4618_c0_g1_i3:90-1058(+)
MCIRDRYQRRVRGRSHFGMDDEEDGEVEETSITGGMAVLCAKLLLLLLNSVLLAAAVFLIYAGAKHQSYLSLTDGILNRGLIPAASNDIFTAAMIVGGILLMISIKGILGAACGARKVLLTYFIMVVLLSAALLYAAVVSWGYSEYADDKKELFFQEVLASNADSPGGAEPEKIKETIELIHQSLQSAWTVCLVLSVLLGLAQLCTARLIGVQYLMSRIGGGINFAGFVCGVLLLVLAVGVWGDELGNFVWILAVAGGLMTIISCVGFAGVMAQSRAVLCVHLTCTMLLVVLVVAGIVVWFLDFDGAKSTVEAQWNATLPGD